jgi:hypothetical protein
MIRGIERRKILLNDRDREDFLERLSKLLPQSETGCYAWVFIPITCPVPLSNWIPSPGLDHEKAPYGIRGQL